jgi:hypothetical protein
MINESCCDTNSSCGCGCKNSNRENKLCELAKPHNKFDVEEVLKLVKNPQYFCRCCGRVANQKESLCNPIELTK